MIPLPYKLRPRSYQWRIMEAQRAGKNILAVMHRRAGKTELLLAMKPMQMLRRAGTYPHVFPRLKQAREIVWQGINGAGMPYLHHFPPELLLRPPNQAEMSISQIHPEGFSRYVLLGTDRNVDSLVGMNSPHVDWDEWSLQNPRARTLALPILDENQGTECVIFTPRGKNHGHGLYQRTRSDARWHVEYLTVEDTRRDSPGEDGSPVITYEAIERRRREERDTTPDIDALIEQEYFLSWDTPMPGAVYAEQLREMDADGRVGTFPYNPQAPTYTAWDIGPAHTAIWWLQPAGDAWHFIDYVEGAGSLASWIDVVRSKPYIYDHSHLTPPLTRSRHERHFGPHDLEQTDYSTGKTRYTIALGSDFRFTIIPRGPVEDGIEAGRQVMRRACFDAVHCEAGLNALRSYRYEWDDTRQTYRQVPVHDWASHGADAFRYAAVGLMPPAVPTSRAPQPGSFAHAAKQADRYWAGRRR